MREHESKKDKQDGALRFRAKPCEAAGFIFQRKDYSSRTSPTPPPPLFG